MCSGLVQSRFGHGYEYELGHELEMPGYIRIDGIWCKVLSEKKMLAKVVTWPGNITCYAAEYEGTVAHGATARDAFANAQYKHNARKSVTERIKDCVKMFIEHSGKMKGKQLFDLHGYLTGSCEFGRKQFLNAHPDIDLNKEYTVAEFVTLTEKEYGGDVVTTMFKAYNAACSNLQTGGC